MRIIVGGLIAQYPYGGVVWDYIQYLLGFQSLGHEVWYLEDTGSWPYHTISETVTKDSSRNVEALRQVMEDFGFQDRWIYRNGATGQFFGQNEQTARELFRNSDVIANVSGALWLIDYDLGSTQQMFLDGDPMFTQLSLFEPHHAERIKAHQSHFSFGLNLGQSDCLVPTGGLEWKQTVQPISLEHWSRAIELPRHGYTTVMTWASYAPKEWQGQVFGQKDLEFQKFMALPQHCSQPMALAMGQGVGRQRPSEKLRQLGWTILEPDEVVPDHRRYRDFLSQSRAEWSVAKHGYVASNSGWFSCRTACYLACGRPAVVQETGWSRTIPSGHGVLAFRTMEECCEQIARVEADYDHHRREARRLAEEYFAADRVCAKLLSDAGLG